ncbi:hypothetical protein, partial [Alcanivorax sp. HI0044]
MKALRLTSLLVMASLAACGGGGGGSGGSNTGTSQAQPEDGLYPSTVERSAFTASEACPDGGITIDQGIDTNTNGVLDPDEIYESQQVCHGASGEDGLSSLIRVDEISAGLECANGGLKVSVGLDASEDGVLDAEEVSQSSYVCSISASQTDGFSSLLDMSNEPEGAECASGGQKLTSGLDFNRNGTLDIDEVIQTKYICNGVSPVVHSSLVKTENIGPGQFCDNGGVKVSSGLDVNEDGLLSEGEITGNAYICHGEDGENSISLVAVEVEAAGANCSAGGNKVTSGQDLNADGTLQAEEVTDVNYICNGTDGIDGEDGLSALVNVSDEPAGVNCPSGGKRIETGQDDNADGILQAAEIDQSDYLCNGENGDSAISSLVRVEQEAAGANCSAGGYVLHTGMDANANAYLDSSEISESHYVCNGEDGAGSGGGDSDGTADMNYFVVNTQLGEVTEIDCPGGASSNSKRKNEYFALASGGQGEPYKVCYHESCYVSTDNGYTHHQKTYGDSACNASEYVYQNCNEGYQWDGVACTEIPPVCPEGQIETTRGCEVPVDSCLENQEIEDNICVDIPYVEVTGNICGNYVDPIKVTAGNHFVTCDTTFNERLLIDAGAVLQVDRNWYIVAESGVNVNGTAVSPVTIKTSPNNIDGAWAGIRFVGEMDFDYDNEELVGDKISYLNVSGYSGTSSLEGVGIKRATLTANAGLTLRDVVSIGTVFDVEDVTSYRSLLSGSSVLSSQLYLWSGLVVNSPDLSNIYTYWGGRTDGFERLAALFNEGFSVAGCSYEAHMQGNESVGTGAATGDHCIVSDNGKPMPESYGVYVLGPKNRDIKTGESLSLEAYLFDKNGFVHPESIVWKARYDVDGTYYDSGQTWTGRKISVSLEDKEQYEVYVESVNGET